MSSSLLRSSGNPRASAPGRREATGRAEHAIPLWVILNLINFSERVNLLIPICSKHFTVLADLRARFDETARVVK
jgi:hypothetical protein